MPVAGASTAKSVDTSNDSCVDVNPLPTVCNLGVSPSNYNLSFAQVWNDWDENKSKYLR